MLLGGGTAHHFRIDPSFGPRTWLGSHSASCSMLQCCVVDTQTDELELQPADLTEVGEGALPGKDGDLTFDVTLEVQLGGFYGADLIAVGKVCVVNGINDRGLIFEWNQDAPAEQKVRKFDRLVAVNGQTSERGKEVLDLARFAEGDTVLTFRRSQVNEVKLSSNGASPAAGLQLKEGPGFLLVTVIDAGAAQEHNATAPVMRQIQPADWIIGVSDLEGAGRTLMDKVINAEKELTLKVAVWR
ncbi:unnamed protein product [Durusdinium trenchii]|uniref:PDZ domain-containing protein n=1 Tax=Durusdinium trenchii TaxID=1381693 RepID=A0ABP0NQI9_9DINO